MIIVLDIDGILCESKTDIDKEMGELLEELSQTNTLVFLTGGLFAQITEKVLSHTKIKRPFYVMPLSGADAWLMEEVEGENRNTVLWHSTLSDDEKGKIMSGIIHTLSAFPRPIAQWGSIIEDRQSQITVSVLGKDAPWNVKKYYDPRTLLRQTIIFNLKRNTVDSNLFEYRIGGSTSIDVTRKGLNKGSTLHKLMTDNKWKIDNITFVGNNLQEGGNNHPILATGVGHIEVNSVQETKDLIKKWITQ